MLRLNPPAVTTANLPVCTTQGPRQYSLFHDSLAALLTSTAPPFLVLQPLCSFQSLSVSPTPTPTPLCCPKFCSGNNRLTFIIITFLLAVSSCLPVLVFTGHLFFVVRLSITTSSPDSPLVCALVFIHPSIHLSTCHCDSLLVRCCGGLRCGSLLFLSGEINWKDD